MKTATAAPDIAGRPWKRALAWLAFLGPVFFATYGFANWAASQRNNVGAIVFEWESHIPFVAWTVVPYWSIDVLYAISLFVCTTRDELDTHGRRLVCAQIIAITCFLLVPLRYTFARPPVDGAAAVLFDALAAFDLPYNQAPSLHIALLVILWVRYTGHFPGFARGLLHAWFALIAVSTLTTYQHHFVDIPTGIWVGWLCVWLFPESARSLLAGARIAAAPQRRALALRYAVAAVGVGAAALVLNGWGLWLLWVAGALMLVATIYLLFGETAFQKRGDGAMSAAGSWLLAPYLAGAWLNSRWWTRASANASVVLPGLLLGRMPTTKEYRALGVAAVVDLTAELPFRSRGIYYASVPQLDLVPPNVEQLGRAAQAIERAYARGPVLVCCALGYSRSAAAVAAWLLASGRAQDACAAAAQVRAARPGTVLGADHLQVLARFARERR